MICIWKIIFLHFLQWKIPQNYSFFRKTKKQKILCLVELILQPFRHFTYVTVNSPTLLSLFLRHSSFSNPSVASPTSQFTLQPFFRFTYVTVHSPTLLSFLLRHWAHSPTFPSLHLCHNSFSNPSVALLILQTFRHFTYVTTHSPALPSLYLRHTSFSSLSVTSPMSQFILQPFRRFTYVTAHSPILPVLHLRHSSSSNPSFASPTSQALHLIHLASRPSHICNLPTGIQAFIIIHDLDRVWTRQILLPTCLPNKLSFGILSCKIYFFLVLLT